MVKYIVVYRHLKAADQKYCQNEQFERDLDDFWPRYCRAKVFDFSRE